MNVRYRAASMMIDDVVPLNSKGVNSLFWIDVCVDIYKLLMITVRSVRCFLSRQYIGLVTFV